MKHFRWVLPVVLLAPATLLGQAAAPKIGIVDFNRAITESAAGMAAATEFQEFYDSLAAGLQELQAKLTEETQALQTQQGALSATAVAERNRTIQSLQTQLQRETEDADAEATLKQDELFRPIVEQAQQALQQYAAEQRFTLILDSQAGIVYAAPSVDVTNEIIRRMDESGAAAPAATPTPAGDAPAPAPETPPQP